MVPFWVVEFVDSSCDAGWSAVGVSVGGGGDDAGDGDGDGDVVGVRFWGLNEEDEDLFLLSQNSTHNNELGSVFIVKSNAC